jgi:hypothetical protein
MVVPEFSTDFSWSDTPQKPKRKEAIVETGGAKHDGKWVVHDFKTETPSPDIQLKPKHKDQMEIGGANYDGKWSMSDGITHSKGQAPSLNIGIYVEPAKDYGKIDSPKRNRSPILLEGHQHTKAEAPSPNLTRRTDLAKDHGKTAMDLGNTAKDHGKPGKDHGKIESLKLEAPQKLESHWKMEMSQMDAAKMSRTEHDQVNIDTPGCEEKPSSIQPTTEVTTPSDASKQPESSNGSGKVKAVPKWKSAIQKVKALKKSPAPSPPVKKGIQFFLCGNFS